MAERLPSLVTAVHSSSSITTSGPPWFTMGLDSENHPRNQSGSLSGFAIVWNWGGSCMCALYMPRELPYDGKTNAST